MTDYTATLKLLRPYLKEYDRVVERDGYALIGFCIPENYLVLSFRADSAGLRVERDFVHKEWFDDVRDSCLAAVGRAVACAVAYLDSGDVGGVAP